MEGLVDELEKISRKEKEGLEKLRSFYKSDKKHNLDFPEGFTEETLNDLNKLLRLNNVYVDIFDDANNILKEIAAIREFLRDFENLNSELEAYEYQNIRLIEKKEIEKEEDSDQKDSLTPNEVFNGSNSKSMSDSKPSDLSDELEMAEKILVKLEKFQELEREEFEKAEKQLEKEFIERTQNKVSDRINHLSKAPTVVFEREVLEHYIEFMHPASRKGFERGGYFHYEAIYGDGYDKAGGLEKILLDQFFEVENVSKSNTSFDPPPEVRRIMEEKGGETQMIKSHCHPIKEGLEMSCTYPSTGGDIAYNNREDMSNIGDRTFDVISSADPLNPENPHRMLITPMWDLGTKFMGGTPLPLWVSENGKMLSSDKLKSLYPIIWKYNSAIVKSSAVATPYSFNWEAFIDNNIRTSIRGSQTYFKKDFDKGSGRISGGIVNKDDLQPLIQNIEMDVDPRDVV